MTNYIIKRKKDNTYYKNGSFSTNDINKAEVLKTGPACAIKMNLDLDKRRKHRNLNIKFESDYQMIEVK